ncbi:MAG: hypothetical protein ACJ8CB_24745 [Ktedonobacteraceae bacterium]
MNEKFPDQGNDPLLSTREPRPLGSAEAPSAPATMTEVSGTGPHVAMRLLIEHALNGKSLPKGWWNPGALLVTQSNVQDIIARQQSLEAKGRFYQPIIDKEFANATAQIKPMDQAK